MSQQELRAPSALEFKLAERIQKNGPISVAAYMEACLSDPEHGYYLSHFPFGAGGDFITAPDISQMFGEIIGAWLMHCWLELGAPSPFNLIEIGPGRGTLMADILRTAKLRPDFLKAAQIYLVETSPLLQETQKETTKEHEVSINWVRRVSEIPAAPSLLFANEFLDCLPLHQFVSVIHEGKRGWKERLIDWSDETKSLYFCLGDTFIANIENAPSPSAPEETLEVCKAHHTFLDELSMTLKSQPLRALFIDYGYTKTLLGDSLQAMKEHAFWPVLATPGEADLTAHVNFESFANEARSAGFSSSNVITQSVLLQHLGLEQRLMALRKKANAQQKTALLEQAQRLVDPEGMGGLFKAICLSSPHLQPAAGFDE